MSTCQYDTFFIFKKGGNTPLDENAEDIKSLKERYNKFPIVGCAGKTSHNWERHFEYVLDVSKENPQYVFKAYTEVPEYPSAFLTIFENGEHASMELKEPISMYDDEAVSAEKQEVINKFIFNETIQTIKNMKGE